MWYGIDAGGFPDTSVFMLDKLTEMGEDMMVIKERRSREIMLIIGFVILLIVLFVKLNQWYKKEQAQKPILTDQVMIEKKYMVENDDDYLDSGSILLDLACAALTSYTHYIEFTTIDRHYKMKVDQKIYEQIPQGAVGMITYQGDTFIRFQNEWIDVQAKKK